MTRYTLVRRQYRQREIQIQFALTADQPLTRDRLERFDRLLIGGRAEMLDVARTAPGAVHDLHRNRSGSGQHRAHGRHTVRLRALLSAQTQLTPKPNSQANAPRQPSRSTSEPSRVLF